MNCGMYDVSTTNVGVHGFPPIGYWPGAVEVRIRWIHGRISSSRLYHGGSRRLLHSNIRRVYRIMKVTCSARTSLVCARVGVNVRFLDRSMRTARAYLAARFTWPAVGAWGTDDRTECVAGSGGNGRRVVVACPLPMIPP